MHFAAPGGRRRFGRGGLGGRAFRYTFNTRLTKPLSI